MVILYFTILLTLKPVTHTSVYINSKLPETIGDDLLERGHRSSRPNPGCLRGGTTSWKKKKPISYYTRRTTIWLYTRSRANTHIMYILRTRKRASCRRVILPFVHISYEKYVYACARVCVRIVRVKRAVRLQDDACPRTVHLTRPNRGWREYENALGDLNVNTNGARARPTRPGVDETVSSGAATETTRPDCARPCAAAVFRVVGNRARHSRIVPFFQLSSIRPRPSPRAVRYGSNLPKNPFFRSSVLCFFRLLVCVGAEGSGNMFFATPDDGSMSLRLFLPATTISRRDYDSDLARFSERARGLFFFLFYDGENRRSRSAHALHTSVRPAGEQLQTGTACVSRIFFAKNPRSDRTAPRGTPQKRVFQPHVRSCGGMRATEQPWRIS